MDRPEKVTVHSITTQKEQTLYLGHEDGDLLDGKRVLLLDDVISTGDSLKALQQLVALFGANIVASAAPLAEATLPIGKTLFSWKNYLCSSNNRAEAVLWEAFICCQIRRKWPL